LFELSVNPIVCIAAMRWLGWAVDVLGLRWRMGLFDWEEELLGECVLLLDNVFFAV